MRDWKGFVRLNLGPLCTSPEREAAIISELAAQLEQTFLNAESRDSARRLPSRRPRNNSQTGNNSPVRSTLRRPNQRLSPLPESVWTGFLRDLRFAARQLARAPSFSICYCGDALLRHRQSAPQAVFSVTEHSHPSWSALLRSPPNLSLSKMRKSDQPEIRTLDLPRSISSTSVGGPVRSRRWWPFHQSGTWFLPGRGSPARRLECLFVSANFFQSLERRCTAEQGRVFSRR